MKKGTIVFVCDDNYSIPTITAITSLLKNKASDIKYKIYICTPGLSEENQALFTAFMFHPWNTEIQLMEMSPDKYASIYKQYDGNTGAGSITALLKFDICNVIKESSVLYLDGDIIVRNDISELFEIDLENKIAAVVKDSGKIYSNNGLRNDLPKYFNSGVMLLNLDMMRDMNMSQKLFNIKKELNSHTLVDQDAFNLAFRGLTKLLPIKYNALLINLNNSVEKFSMRQLNKFYGTYYSCLYDLEDDVSILHFASKEKPWKYSDTAYADEWMAYYQVSPINKPLNRTIYFSNTTNTVSGTYQTTIPIILATDINYVPQTSVTIISALENRTANTIYHFYILVPQVFDQSTSESFEEISTHYKNCKIEFIEMNDAFSDCKLNIAHITSPTFYRLKAPSLLPQYKKAIYIDSDVVVEGDLAYYYQTNLDNYYIGGVKAPSYHFAPNGNLEYCKNNGLPAIDQYINAGVILMNLDKMRQDNIEDRFIELSKCGFRSQDQDIINGVCYNHIKHLPYKYNCMITKYETVPEQALNVFTIPEINEAYNRPIITHYAAEDKPWKCVDCALADRWWKYARLSPFYNQILAKYISCIVDNAQKKRLIFLYGKNSSTQDSSQNEANAIRASWTYKIGRFITFIPRKIRGGIRCYQEHGMSYTLRRVKEKFLSLFGR